jgi:hypothetical protein
MRKFYMWWVFILALSLNAASVVRAQDKLGFEWVKKNADILTRAQAIDAEGNFYYTGNFNGTQDFDPGPGVFNLTAPAGGFVVKLNPDGEFLWAKATTTSFTSRSISVDNSGNILVSGSFQNTVDFDPGPGVANVTAAGTGNSDGFIWKLDSNGNFVWIRTIQGPSAIETAWAVQVDATGNVYTTGNFGGTIDFDNGPGVVNLTSAGGADIFITKHNSNGNLEWAKRIGSTGTDNGRSITIDAAGNPYLSGSFSGSVDFDPNAGVANLTSNGEIDAFVLKLDTNAIQGVTHR